MKIMKEYKASSFVPKAVRIYLHELRALHGKEPLHFGRILQSPNVCWHYKSR